MSKFSLNGFKKVSKTPDTTTLRHPLGHELTIKHTALSPKLRGDIEALPHVSEKHPDTTVPKAPTVAKFASGGQAQGDEPKQEPKADDTSPGFHELEQKETSPGAGISGKNPESAALADYNTAQESKTSPESMSNTDLSKAQDLSKLIDSHHKLVSAATPGSTPDTSAPDQSVQPVTAQDQSAAGTGQMVQPVTPQDQAAAGINQPASATPDQSQTPTPPSTDNSTAVPAPATPVSMSGLNTAVNDAKNYVTAAEAKNQQFEDAAKAGKIDPKQYFQNLNTVGKISSIVGLLMGGIGAAGTGGKNLAVGALNEAVQRDVDAQIANKTNNMNLYKMNLEATKNGEEARNMTVNQQLTLVQAALAKQLAGTTNAQAIQNLQKGNEEIKQLKFANDTNAFQARMRDQIATGAPGSTPLSTKIQYGLPKEQQAEGEKQASEYDSLKRTADNVNQIFDNMEKEQTPGNLANPQSYLRQKQNKAALVQAIMETSPSKRLTKESIEQEIKPFEFGTGSTQQTIDAARKGVLDIVKAHSGPMNLLADRGMIPQLDQITAPSPTKYLNGVPYKLGPDKQYHRVK